MTVFDDGMIWRLADSLIQTMMARLNIKLPAMPWTRHDVASQHTFSKGAASVGTDSVKHVKSTVDVIDGKDSSFGNDFRRASWSDLVGFDQRDFCHRITIGP